MTVLACFMIMIMLMLGGVGVDLMRHEMERTRMQAVADRAVLAAADLDQLADPEAVVRDYFDKAGMAEFIISVNVDPNSGVNFRAVDVDASSTMNTQFMKTLGVPTLVIPARAKAAERVNKVEISMVLDISGSMQDNSKMENMQTAAKEFVTAVLKPDNKDLISVNLIPYSQHVNAGDDIYDRLNVSGFSNNPARCIEFNDSDYGTVPLDKSRTYTQMQNFQWNYYSIETGNQTNTLHDTVCPHEDYESITAFSQDKEALHDQIDLLQPRAGTQIFMGMKWAAAMLDPAFQSITSSIAANSGSVENKIDPTFSDRPVAYAEDDTLKTIILMTDGQNSSAARIAPYYYRNSDLVEQWNNRNLQYHLYNYVSSRYRSRYYYNKYTASAGDTLLYNMCDAAKEKKILIWSIGFEVEDHGANVMKYCASSPNHFFRVEGINLSDAFKAIASQINQLRLTQ